MLKKALWTVSVVITLFFLVSVLYLLFILSAIDGKDYSTKELEEYFDNNEATIYELKAYFEQLATKDYLVELEFEDDYTLSRVVIGSLKTSNGDSSFFQEWDIAINSSEGNTILSSLGWTLTDVNLLKSKLDKAGCIGINNESPMKINFQRSGMGMYSFNLFDDPLSAKQLQQYNDSCTYILIQEHVAIEYGGGAIGAQCFYKFE